MSISCAVEKEEETPVETSGRRSPLERKPTSRNLTKVQTLANEWYTLRRCTYTFPTLDLHNYSVVCRFRLVYVSRATGWPTRQTQEQRPLSRTCSSSIEIFCTSRKREYLFLDTFVHKNDPFRRNVTTYRTIYPFIE